MTTGVELESVLEDVDPSGAVADSPDDPDEVVAPDDTLASYVRTSVISTWSMTKRSSAQYEPPPAARTRTATANSTTRLVRRFFGRGACR